MKRVLIMPEGLVLSDMRNTPAPSPEVALERTTMEDLARVAELAAEKGTQRIVALSQELENALSEQSAVSKPKPHSAQ